MRESYVGHEVVHHLSELAIGGTAESLLGRLRASRLANDRKLTVASSVFYRIFDALATLHEASPPRYHGDVKLGNVLIAPEAGANTRVVLHDPGPRGSARQDRRELAKEIEEIGKRFGFAMPPAARKELIAELRNPARPLRAIMDHPYFENRLTDEELTAELAHLLPFR